VQKCALIVDDSRTARQVLGGLLQNHQMRVETAESAEDALEYLSNARPDVIFMDHMMPGMDGFQAVRAIKNNPATATIPIMMYTSQKGELYVGQARALGAVGVLPKQIQPVEVSAMLESLHLIPENSTPDLKTHEIDDIEIFDGSQTIADVERTMELANWSELHNWLEQMFQHHEQALRDDIESSIARVFEEKQKSNAAETKAEFENLLSEKDFSVKRQRLTVSFTIVLALLAAALFWLQMDAQQKWRAVSEQNDGLLAAMDWQRNNAAGQSAVSGEVTEAQEIIPANQYLEFVAALEWTVNQFTAYEPADLLLGDNSLDRIDGLVRQLRSIGFSGTVQVDSHLGDFCYVRNLDGGYQLAPADFPVDACDRIGIPPDEAQDLSSRQSVGFTNYMSALASEEQDAIRVQVNAHGNFRPIYPYPPELEGVTAGDWNKAARQNNRVQIRLLPDTDQPISPGY